MGNCLKTTAVTDHSPSATKPFSPESLKNYIMKPNGLVIKEYSVNKYAAPCNTNNYKQDDHNHNNHRNPHSVERPNSKKCPNEATKDGCSEGKMMKRNLKQFSIDELKSATRNFSNMIGEGGFGKVYKGWMDGETLVPSPKVGVGIAVAVKKSNPNSDQGLREWQCEVNFLGKFSHPNLVKLLGYSWEDNNFLLVYEHIQKGSLEKHLFRVGGEILSWETRLKIAVGAAQGLAFLHTSEKTVIYRDFKTSNILLDGEYNAKLSDFGLAKLGPQGGDTHVTTQVMGTYGYAAPEYIATGHLYVKSDVYGFGVVLLELLTGLKALDCNRPSGEHNLIDWAKPSLSDKRTVKKMVDPRLEGEYPPKAATKTAALILTCLDQDPKRRPSMEQVLETLLQVTHVDNPSKHT